jgi:protein phosphatase
MPMNVVEIGAATDVGQVRRSNEDSHLVASPLFVVADGMGGANAGEVASALAVEAMTRTETRPGWDSEESLRRSIAEANRRIHERASHDPNAAGMGTTVTAALVNDGRIAFGHVGDSRAYLLRDGVLQQLSDDHSLVGELVRRGALSPEEAARHPQRSIITRALGADGAVDIDTFSIDAQDGDVVLLCSDGLSGMVGEDEMQRILLSGATLPQVARELVVAANAAGGDDNVTAIVFRIGDGPTMEHAAINEPAVHIPYEPPPPPEPPREQASHFRRAFLLAVVALVLLAAAALGVVGLRWAHFVGASDSGHVAVYQGVPLDLGAGLRLYRQVDASPLLVSTLTREERASLFDHEIVSMDEAQRRVGRVVRERPWDLPRAQASPDASTTEPTAS